MICIEIVIPVLFLLRVDGEWVQIPQSSEQISDHKVKIASSMLPAEGFEVKDLNQLKYEQLAGIIGPGFEAEFSKFLKRHSHEMSANGNEFGDRNQSIGLTTLYVDPWLKYDPDYTTTPFITSKPMWTDFAYKNASIDYRIVSTTTSTTIAPIDIPQMNSTTTVKPTQASVGIAAETALESSSQMPRPGNKTSAAKVTNSTKPVRNRKTNRIKWVQYNPFTFADIFGFWRKIQSTFSMGTARSVAGKIQILNKFKDDLLRNIEERLKLVWPTQAEKKEKRSKRGLMDHGGGHDGDFPSTETALMTISILTFAVFLIKLVLQVIHTMKSKHYAYNGLQTMSAQGEAPIKVIKGNRNARRISFSDNDEIERLAATMLSIEESTESFN